MRHGIWATLDIDPTTDRSAIRKAYAARLKAMDVDADPDGFAALRSARDAALAGVEAAFDPAPAPPEPVETEPDPEVAAFHGAINAHFHALEALLFPGHAAPPTPEELAAIEHHGLALLADPRLEQVDFAASAERWYAETLSAGIPRSDPLLEPAAATFGWIDRRDDYALSAEALTIVERIGAIRFTRLLDDPKHRLHRAWVELNRGEGRSAPLWNPKGPRKEILSLIRDRFPIVEGWLEPRRVADADDPKSPVIGAQVWVFIFIVVTAVRIFLSGTEERKPAPPPPPPVYAPMPTADAPVMPAPPPAVYRYISGLTHAPDAHIRAITEWELKVMQYYEPFDPAQCVDTSLFRTDAKLSMIWDQRRHALIGQLLADARNERLPAPSSRLVIRGEMVDAAQKRSGLKPADFKRAFDKDAPIADQCKAIIALREAALARPNQGNKLLRQLQLSIFGE